MANPSFNINISKYIMNVYIVQELIFININIKNRNSQLL